MVARIHVTGVESLNVIYESHLNQYKYRERYTNDAVVYNANIVNVFLNSMYDDDNDV